METVKAFLALFTHQGQKYLCRRIEDGSRHRGSKNRYLLCKNFYKYLRATKSQNHMLIHGERPDRRYLGHR